MRHWLMKTEPDEFSIDDLEQRRVEPWTGVRNYQARNFMRDGMKVGDGVLFYHSSCADARRGRDRRDRRRGVARPDPVRSARATTTIPPARHTTRAGCAWTWRFERKLRGVITAGCDPRAGGVARGPDPARARQPPVGVPGRQAPLRPDPQTGAQDVSQDNEKRASAEKAIGYVEDGSIVGVGTGSTVAFFIEALGADPRPHRGRGVEFGAEHAAPRGARHPRARPQFAAATCRCTSTAPTSAIRTSA